LGHPYNGNLVDVWSLGVVFFTLMTGEFPFPNVHQLLVREYEAIKGASSLCEDFVSKMLVVKPQNRASLSDIIAHPFITADLIKVDYVINQV
jgi:serine/threonine protein kinase